MKIFKKYVIFSPKEDNLMKTEVILFDLDGTLLPLDQDVFVERYFSLIAKKLAPHGFDPEKLIKTVWAGTKAMTMNTGEKSNEQVFWDKFREVYRDAADLALPVLEDFYRIEFDGVREICEYTPAAAQIINKVKSLGFRTVLATNPLFPSLATKKRALWAGLTLSDFEFYTTYENSRHCKPNLDYYRDICAMLGVLPEQCLMVGNDTGEDMIAKELGMKVFLLTNHIINKNDVDISVYPHGSFTELSAFLDTLPR